MATPARPHINEATATPALLSASSQGLYSSSSPSVRTPREQVAYHPHPVSHASASGGLLSAKLLDRTLNSDYGEPFDYAEGQVRPFASHASATLAGKLQPAPPLIRSQTLPSYTSSYLQAWDATHSFQPAQHASHIAGMQRCHSAANTTDKDSDTSRYDKRRKMRHSSPAAEEIEHLQLAISEPNARSQAMVYQSLQPSLIHDARSGPSNYDARLSSSSSTARHPAHIPSRPLFAQPEASASKRKSDQLQVDISQQRPVSPAPSYYSHASLHDMGGDDDEDEESAPSSPVDAEPSLHHTRPAITTAISAPIIPTRRSTRHRSDEDGFSSSTSEYNPDGTTPAKVKRVQPHKQGKKKASKKAAALMSDPDYAVASSVPTPRIINKKPDNGAKPSYSYAALIGQAILSSDGKLLSLNDIYCFIMVNYTYFKKDVAGWQNSIRHNLSLNPSFVKVARSANNPGKGSLWTIKPGDEELFANGGYIKRAAMQRTGGVPQEQEASAPSPALAEVSSPGPSHSAPSSLEPPADMAPAVQRRTSAPSPAPSALKTEPIESVKASAAPASSKSLTPEPQVKQTPAIGVQGPSNQSAPPVASVQQQADEESDLPSDSDTEEPAQPAKLNVVQAGDIFQRPRSAGHQRTLKNGNEPAQRTKSRESSPCDSLTESAEPSKPQGSNHSQPLGLGAPVDLDASAHIKRPFKRPEQASNAEPIFSRPIEGEDLHRRSLFASPAQRLRSPRRNSLSGAPSFDYAHLGSYTPGDSRSRIFGTPNQRSPGVFNSPAYFFSSEAYGDPNDLHSIVVAELDRRDMSPAPNNGNNPAAGILNTPGYARALGKTW